MLFTFYCSFSITTHNILISYKTLPVSNYLIMRFLEYGLVEGSKSERRSRWQHLIILSAFFLDVLIYICM